MTRRYAPWMLVEHLDLALAGTPPRAKLFLLCVRHAYPDPWQTTCPAIAAMLATQAGNRPPEGPDPSNVWRALQWLADNGVIEVEATPGSVAGATAGVVIRYPKHGPKRTTAKSGCKGAAAPTPPAADDSPPGFLRFWAAWPRSQRKAGKAVCLAEWKKRNLEAATEKVLAVLAAKCQCHDWLKEGGQYIPAPVVWLRACGYDADPADLTAPPPAPRNAGDWGARRGQVAPAAGDPRGFAVGKRVE